MELWIRSQNKGALIKVEMLGNTDGTITSYLGINQTELGKYKSSKRALEVLDEIQNLLKGVVLEKHINKFDIYNGENLKIYEMPEE